MKRWLVLTLVTMLLWGGWGVLSKALSSRLTGWEMQVLSTAGMLPVMALLVRPRRGQASSQGRRGFVEAFLAGLMASVGNLACYQALAAGGKAAAVIPLTSLYPLVTILLAWMFLHERLNRIQQGGIALSALALWCFNLDAGPGGLTPWLAVALVPVGCWGVSALLQKLATNHTSNERATLAFLLGFLPAALFVPLVQPLGWALDGPGWLMVLLLGLSFALGNWTLLRAYGAGGKASVVTPMASLYSLVTIPGAVMVLGERISRRESLGIIIALTAVLALGWERPAEGSPDPTRTSNS